MFMQVDNSIHRTQGGLGIGLTLVKSIAREAAMKGAWKSQAAAKTRNPIHREPLPIAKQDQFALTMQEETQAPASDSYQILVVDDNEASAKTLGWMLETLGHKVDLAYDAQEAR